MSFMQKKKTIFYSILDRKTSWRTIDANTSKDALVEVYVAILRFGVQQCVLRSNCERPSNLKNVSNESEVS